MDSLTPLEIASGLVFGPDPRARSLDAPDVRERPIQAFERAVLPALGNPPCLVSFSGGRDSSAVLAVAARVARREGLPLPVPATNRFPSVETSDEAEWQERVVAHLQLEDWLRLEHEDELDCVGPIARKVLESHGLIWPFNAHFHVPLLQAASGGSLLTGVGGDEALSGSTWSRARAVLGGQVVPRPRDALRVGFALSPRRVRRVVLRRRAPRNYFAWLRNDARQQVFAAWADEAASEPVRWAARYRWWLRLRYITRSVQSLGVLAADEDVCIVHPFTSPDFSAAMGTIVRSQRFDNRSQAMRLLFGDVLPPDVLARSSKASFDQAFWNRHARTLASQWTGEGVDERLVDAERLRDEWSSPSPDGRSFTLLQSVWLARRERRALAADRLEQPFARAGERRPSLRTAQLPAR